MVKDIVENKVNIINSSKINNNILENTFISTFDENYNLIRNIKSNKIDIQDQKWIIYDASVFEKNKNINVNQLEFLTNFNQQRIESLFSNLSSLSLLKLFDLEITIKLSTIL